ncbi:hypothetical protein [Nocardia sp. NPDC051832]|uniref:hypothetical protein n=1 Tax=Nocardia sp. NPDC051832 TaxID=3155673 RepID=UPI003413ABA5
MTESLTMRAITTVSELVNSYATEIAGADLPPLSWMWDCCARFGDAEAELCGTCHPDLPAREANSQVLAWARALNLHDSTTARDVADGRRAFSGTLGESRIRLTAVVESTSPATETQPLIILA